MSHLDNIREAMKVQRRTQAEAGELIGLSNAQMSQILSGSQPLRLSDAEVLMRWLNIEPTPKIIGARDAQIAEIFDVVLDLSLKMNAVIEASALMSARLASLEVKVAAMAARLDRASIRSMGFSE